MATMSSKTSQNFLSFNSERPSTSRNRHCAAATIVALAASGFSWCPPAAFRHRHSGLSHRRCVCQSLSASARFSETEDAPRIAWSFWDKGADKLPDFRRLCVETWAAQNPNWEIRILDQSNVYEYLSAQELPRLWKEMYVPWQADAVRLALLARYGGLWIDASTICLQPFDRWIYDAIASDAPEHSAGIGAFYFSAWGCEMHKSKEFVENWVMASRRQHPFLIAWKALFNGYWNSKNRADAMSMFLDPPGVPDHPLFQGVNLDHLKRFGQDLRNYLLMHAAFKKLIDQYPEFRRIWEEEMILLRADDTAFWHMEEPDVHWDAEAAIRKWRGKLDPSWLEYVIKKCPVLKFTRDTAVLLDEVPRSDLLTAGTSLGEAFRTALKPSSDQNWK
eukprot:TRINITY_DN114208_c0_g1_i1.p1 TRINITY_DN114208_c0_g1~~TRINITY_DN114208_c0_g1_i1.p1  ORF type:complete len:403 (-),score=57.66 TRINITY_DN114208_c0_g1_i1:8-1177(-)